MASLCVVSILPARARRRVADAARLVVCLPTMMRHRRSKQKSGGCLTKTRVDGGGFVLFIPPKPSTPASGVGLGWE